MFQEYQEFFEVLWHTDEYGNKVSIKRLNEQQKIVNNRIVLKEIPDNFYKIQITGKYEIDISQVISNAIYFKTDYLTGEVYFHPSLEGQTITIAQYFGRGLIKTFAKRVLLADNDNLYNSDNVEDFATEITNKVDDFATEITQRVDNIVLNTGDSNAEIVDARYSSKKDETFSTLGNRLDDIEDMTDITSLDIASQYGVDSSIGTLDATVLLNNYFTSLKTKGLKYAYFDKPHTYNVSGELSEARDLILIGNAEINSTNIGNYFIQIAKDFNFYNGKFNSVPFSLTQFAQFIQSLGEARNVKIGLIGDSITRAGTSTDCLNIGFNNTNAGLDMEEGSPSNLTLGDAYYHRLIDMLTTKFKDNIFDFYNRAIGGTRIDEWYNDKTFDSVTKPWIDHMKDVNPDLLIIGWGMNNNYYANAITFKYHLKSILDYINANFTTIPSIAIVTTPRPTNAIGYTWGTSEGQFSRDMAAYQARKYGYERGCYIIDVNKISNIKRIGRSFDNIILKEIDISNIITGNYTEEIVGEYVMQLGTQHLNINANLKDFAIQFDAKFESFPGSSSNLWVDMNYIDGLNSNNILLKPKLSTGVARIETYANRADSANLGNTITKSWSDSTDWNDGVYRTIRIEKREDIIEIFINNIRKLRDRYQINNVPGIIILKKNAGDIGIITLKNIKVYAGTYKQYTPTMTEYETFGLFEDGIYTTKPLIGGNGANHPSTIGVEELYVVALTEFVEDLSRH